jgi:hypothetical protein
MITDAFIVSTLLIIYGSKSCSAGKHIGLNPFCVSVGKKESFGDQVAFFVTIECSEIKMA